MTGEIKNKGKKVAGKLLKSNSLLPTFLRSGVSSQTSGFVDFCVSFASFAWLNLMPWLSTAIGAVAGGVVNCLINYKFTFRAQGLEWKAVVLKFFLIWAGSLILNSAGTQGVYMLIDGWHWLETIGFKPDGYYAAARLFVSLMVSWFWNFVMQRNFVYRRTKFDPTAVKIFNFFFWSQEGET